MTPSIPASPGVSPRTQALLAAATGVATFVHYACPDVIKGRAARGWFKVGLSVVMTAVSIGAFGRASRDAAQSDTAARADEPTEPEAQAEARPDLTTDSVEPVAVGLGLAALAGSVTASVALEKWVFRHGQARAAAGKRLPHTAPALGYGALAALATLVPVQGRRTS